MVEAASVSTVCACVAMSTPLTALPHTSNCTPRLTPEAGKVEAIGDKGTYRDVGSSARTPMIRVSTIEDVMSTRRM
jgi:hypothetical protein